VCVSFLSERERAEGRLGGHAGPLPSAAVTGDGRKMYTVDVPPVTTLWSVRREAEMSPFETGRGYPLPPTFVCAENRGVRGCENVSVEMIEV